LKGFIREQGGILRGKRKGRGGKEGSLRGKQEKGLV